METGEIINNYLTLLKDKFHISIIVFLIRLSLCSKLPQLNRYVTLLHETINNEKKSKVICKEKLNKIKPI
jgi:hypothetical protein